MTLATVDTERLVRAAQAGDQRARDELIATYLPLVYNIVGRALHGHADVDDVVQDTLLRAVRDLTALRTPESFRAWLVTIALRQIATHRHRQRATTARVTAIDYFDEIPADGDLAEDTVLRLYLTDQRRQVVEATRWLDPGVRQLLALWWQENAGWLNRAEIATLTGTTVAHVGVRLQRMREQLDVARTIVEVLERRPRCARLPATIDRWGGDPSPLWRKRIARHIRDCRDCAATGAGRVATDRLLLAVAPLAVPAGLAAALTLKGLLTGGSAGAVTVGAATGTGGSSGAGTAGSMLGKLTAAVVTHPWLSLTAAAVLLAGAATGYAVRPGRAPHPPVVAAPAPVPTTAASPAPGTPPPGLPVGTWSLAALDQPGRYLTFAGDYAAVQPIAENSALPARQRATLTVIAGLADGHCVTFRTSDGRYLRHSQFRLRLSADDGTALFRADATFCVRPGAGTGSVVLQSHNYPALVLRHRDGGVYLDAPDGTADFTRASSFRVRAPWA